MNTKRTSPIYYAHPTSIELHQSEYVEKWLRKHKVTRWKLGPYMTKDGSSKLMIYVSNKQDLTAAELKEGLDSYLSNFRGTRRLNARWTVEQSSDILSLHSIDVEQDLARSMAQEIDKEIMGSLHGTNSNKYTTN